MYNQGWGEVNLSHRTHQKQITHATSAANSVMRESIEAAYRQKKIKKTKEN